MIAVQEANVIDQTIEYVRQTLYNDATGHDWWHVYRVWRMAQKIQVDSPNADILVVELSALLHDIADWKNHNGDSSIGAIVARNWLISLETVSPDQIDQICYIVENISFKSADSPQIKLPIEGQIVQDADRLDAMGAIGIARTFAFGGSRGRLIFEPNNKDSDCIDTISYLKDSSSIDHFHNKLLLIKDLMNTRLGKIIAQKRHKFMLNYLSQFYAEWEGNG